MFEIRKQQVVRTVRWLRTTRGRTTRTYNLLRSYVASRRKPEVTAAYPFALHVEPALTCNYRCPACRHERRDKAPKDGKFMDVEAYKRLLDQVKGRTWNIDFTGNGESTLHPRFYEMVSYAVDNGFYTRFETNGSRIDVDQIEASGIHSIHFALDGMSQETYARYRIRGNFEKVKANLERLAELSRRVGRPRVEVRFIVFRHNEHEIEEARRYLQSLGINWRFQWGRIPNGFDDPQSILQKWDLEITPEAFAEWSSTLPEFTAYEPDRGTGLYRHFVTRGELEAKCTAPWTMLLVRCDGEIIPCCEMSNESELSLGNVLTEPFDEVWNGPRIREFRKRLRDAPESLYPCNVCPANFVCHGEPEPGEYKVYHEVTPVVQELLEVEEAPAPEVGVAVP